jgi:hypothetical protein
MTFQGSCNKEGFDLDLGLHLKNLISFATNQSRFLTAGKLPLESLQIAWKNACPGMEFAINFLKSNVGIKSSVLLSSNFILITLAKYGHSKNYELSPQESDKLRFWTLLSNAKGHYSRGSSETILNQDLATIRDGGKIDDLITRLQLQVTRFETTPEELEGRNQRSALFKTMFLAFSADGAKDWRSNLAISLEHSGNQHKLQFHHIFAKALLKKIVTDREADDIANLAFIGGNTNQHISDKAPLEYIPRLIEKIGTKPFEAQCIPTEPTLLKLESYKDFLLKRRRLIAYSINHYLGVDAEK